MMDILLVHDGLAAPRATRHTNTLYTQSTPCDRASNTHARLPTPPRTARHPRWSCTHSPQQWPFWPSASFTPAHSIAPPHTRAHTRAMRLAHTAPASRHAARLATAAHRLAHTRPLEISLAITPGGNTMDTGTGIASCFSATLSACTLCFYFPVPVVWTDARVSLRRSHRLRA